MWDHLRLEALLAMGAASVLVYIIWGPKTAKTRSTSADGAIGGLQNMGSSCFLNAVLQALASSPAVNQWLTQAVGPTPGHRQLEMALLTTIQVVNRTHSRLQSDPFSPEAVTASLSALGWLVRREEQDTHEMFHVLMSTLQEAAAPLPVLSAATLSGSSSSQVKSSHLAQTQSPSKRSVVSTCKPLPVGVQANGIADNTTEYGGSGDSGKCFAGVNGSFTNDKGFTSDCDQRRHCSAGSQCEVSSADGVYVVDDTGDVCAVGGADDVCEIGGSGGDRGSGDTGDPAVDTDASDSGIGGDVLSDSGSGCVADVGASGDAGDICGGGDGSVEPPDGGTNCSPDGVGVGVDAETASRGFGVGLRSTEPNLSGGGLDSAGCAFVPTPVRSATPAGAGGVHIDAGSSPVDDHTGDSVATDSAVGRDLEGAAPQHGLNGAGPSLRDDAISFSSSVSRLITEVGDLSAGRRSPVGACERTFVAVALDCRRDAPPVAEAVGHGISAVRLAEPPSAAPGLPLSAVSDGQSRRVRLGGSCVSGEGRCPARLGRGIVHRVQGAAHLTRHGQTRTTPFSGTVSTQLTCLTCGHKCPVRWESFESLSLPLPITSPPMTSPPTGLSLSSLLTQFSSRETVHDVVCDACGRRGSFSKRSLVAKLPASLCVHLPRSTWQDSGCAGKRADHVTFFETLNMYPYTYAAHTKVSATVSVPLLRDNGRHTYRLTGVIVHTGDASSGHFVTYRRLADPSDARWFYTSDSVVSRATRAEVFGAAAYMLFYDRVRDGRPPPRPVAAT